MIMSISNPQTKTKCLVLAALLTGLFIFGLPAQASAIEENTDTVPDFIVRPGDPNANLCRIDNSSPIHKHGQDVWLSQRGANWVQEINVEAGTESVDLMINSLSRHCNSNIDSSGNIVDKSIQETRTNTVSLTASTPGVSIGAVAGTTTAPFPYDVTLDYGPSHFYNQRYVVSGFGPAFQVFRLSGLSGLAPGQTHTIQVAYKYRMVHRYEGGIYRCVDGGAIASNGLSGTNCPENTIYRTIRINVGTSIFISAGGTCDSGIIRGGARIMGDPSPKNVVLQRRNPNGQYVEVERMLANLPSTNPAGRWHGYVFEFDVRKYFTVYDEGYRVLILGTTHHDNVTLPACANVACGGYDIDVGTPEPGEQFNLTARLNLENFGTQGRARDLRYDIVLNISSDSQGNNPLPGFPVTSARSLAPAWGTESVFENLLINSSDSYHIRYRIRIWNPGSGGTITNRSVLCAEGEEVDISTLPYHKVYGGDVLAGMSATGSDGACSVNESAFIRGRSNGSSSYSGAGAQLAVFALGEITGFASAQFRNVPKGLSFANLPESVEYGGNLEQAALSCGPNYWSTAPNNPEGSQRLFGRNLGMGQTETKYIKGDVIIEDNITYAGGMYSNIDQIPQFRLIVKGNIYIRGSVSEISGLFVAIRDEDRADPTGRFYTCGRYVNRPLPPNGPLLRNGMCNNKLTVYGAVVADQIKFSRTPGTVGNATTNENYQAGGDPAEVFIYTPELWLRSGSGGRGGAASFSTLPPVL